MKRQLGIFMMIGALALPAAAAAPEASPLPTIAIPGLFAPEFTQEERELWAQQLAATLEGKGFKVLDASALRERGAPVPEQGCHLPLAPLCGKAPGVDDVVIGSVLQGEVEGSVKVTLELIRASDRHPLWGGGFTAASSGEVSMGLSRIAADYLPAAARSGQPVVDRRPRVLGLTQSQWGSGTAIVGAVSAVAGGAFILESQNTLKKRDALRYFPEDEISDATYRRQLITGISLGAVGVGALITGLVLWAGAPPPPVAVQVAPESGTGLLVFTGVLP